MYDNKRKDAWRSFYWKQTSDRMGKRCGQRRTVMVLAGDCAGDLAHARRHRIRCVAVDRSLKCVENYRKAGGVAIQDTLINQIRAFQPTALLADLVSGLTRNTLDIMYGATMLCDVLVINMLRGREHNWVPWRESDTVASYVNGKCRQVRIGKHRGRMLYSCIVTLLAMECNFTTKKTRDGLFVPDEVCRVFDNELRPCYYSYRSLDSGQYFDTVAITTTMLSPSEAQRKGVRCRAPKKSRGRAAAAKAILTQRYG